MPTTRRSTGRASAASGKQSTLSFSNRVTKSSVTKPTKDLVSSGKAASSPLAKQVEKEQEKAAEEDEVTLEPAQAEEAEPEAEPEPEAEKSEVELRAQDITDRQITKYWNGLEAERKAKRVHQEDLTLSEKVLRYFDVSSQYGPCVGITRMKRWQRAERLGLNPPVEVLAVLLKEEAKGTKGVKAAHMDYILNSTAVGAN